MLSWCSVTCEWLTSWYHLNGQFRVNYTTFRRWLEWCNTNKQSILLKTQSIWSLWKQTYIHTFKNLNVYSNYYVLAVCFLIDTTWIESQIIIQVVVQIFIFKLVKLIYYDLWHSQEIAARLNNVHTTKLEWREENSFAKVSLLKQF